MEQRCSRRSARSKQAWGHQRAKRFGIKRTGIGRQSTTRLTWQVEIGIASQRIGVVINIRSRSLARMRDRVCAGSLGKDIRIAQGHRPEDRKRDHNPLSHSKRTACLSTSCCHVSKFLSGSEHIQKCDSTRRTRSRTRRRLAKSADYSKTNLRRIPKPPIRDPPLRAA